MLRFATLLTFTLLATTACQGALANTPASARPVAKRAAAAKAAPIQQVTVQDAAKALAANPGLRFIDVRTPEEFSEGRAKGAKNLPLAELATWAAELPKDQPLVVICRSGSRSGKACAALAQQGFTTLTNVQGGTLAWEADGTLPMEKGAPKP